MSKNRDEHEVDKDQLTFLQFGGSNEPLIVAVGEIEAISPREYRNPGGAHCSGSTVHMRSGEKFAINTPPGEVRALLLRILERGSR